MKEYFSHDYNTRSDEKIQLLIFKHGWSGYGLFWALIEMLYQNDGYIQLDYDRIAFELRTDKLLIDSIINEFGLFKINEEKFYSTSINRRLKKRKEKSEKAKKSAVSRWSKEKAKDANALQTDSERNAIKEKKRIYIYNIFYDEQLEISNNNNNYKSFIEFLFKKNPLNRRLNTVLSMKDQITFDRFNEIIKNYGSQKIKEKLLGIENSTKKYKSLNLTLTNWLKK